MISTKEREDSIESLKRIMHPLVKKWFFSKFPGFSIPQKFGIMEVHSRNNVLITAPTGGTKTLTAFLGILNELIDSSLKGILENRVYCVYISPLKALNNDIQKNLIEPLKEMEKLHGKPLGINIQVRSGDSTPYQKSKMAKESPHILITTPESLGIILNAPKFILKFSDVQWLIIDEIHAVAENKRGTHLAMSIERLQNISTAMCRVGLSATIAPIEEIAKFLVGYKDGKVRDCKIIDVKFSKEKDFKVISPVRNLVDSSYTSMHKSMYKTLHNLIQKHKTTLIFTNTRAGTERVVHFLKEIYPKHYNETNIGAHHGSLSKIHRKNIEDSLKEGTLKVAVSSTSLELGIDIGYIDLVVCLGSPKSVARFLQRAGRAGHKLHETVKARLVVMDRDDLVECAVLLKAAIEGEIDRIMIPKGALDVLAQHIYGIAINKEIHIDDLFVLIKQSYPYSDLSRVDYEELIKYLAGEFSSLETKHVYAKIRHNKASGIISRRGKLARVIYMTNTGTIPDQTSIIVKVGDTPIGKLDENFLEKLKRGDTFVLGGSTFEFKYARGQTAQVDAAYDSLPTVPSWVSQSLPLSFDLANKVGHFRKLMYEMLRQKLPKAHIIEFINNYLYVDKNSSEAIYNYFLEQDLFARVANSDQLLIEKVTDEDDKYTVVHTLYGKRTNDAISRAVALLLSKLHNVDIEIAINDNGFLLKSKKHLSVKKGLTLLASDKLDLVLKGAIENSEILRRRFRHVAARGLMILRNYMGIKKRVGRQQVSSMILLKAVKRLSSEFPLLKEARREVLEEAMDINSAKEVIGRIEKGKIKLKVIETNIPSPFAFNLATQGYSDIMKIEDKIDFLRRMHKMVLAKIGKNDPRARELFFA